MMRYDPYTDSFIDNPTKETTATINLNAFPKNIIQMNVVDVSDASIEKIADAVVRKLIDCKTEPSSSEIPNSSTRSKMEQVDKDINVRSKDEQQKDCNGCKFVGTYDTEFPCANCSRKTKDYYAKDEPQTDCAWK